MLIHMLDTLIYYTALEWYSISIEFGCTQKKKTIQRKQFHSILHFQNSHDIWHIHILNFHTRPHKNWKISKTLFHLGIYDRIIFSTRNSPNQTKYYAYFIYVYVLYMRKFRCTTFNKNTKLPTTHMQNETLPITLEKSIF